MKKGAMRISVEEWDAEAEGRANAKALRCKCPWSTWYVWETARSPVWLKQCAWGENRRPWDQRGELAGQRMYSMGSKGHRKDFGFTLSGGEATEGFEHSNGMTCFKTASTLLSSWCVGRRDCSDIRTEADRPQRRSLQPPRQSWWLAKPGWQQWG